MTQPDAVLQSLVASFEQDYRDYAPLVDLGPVCPACNRPDSADFFCSKCGFQVRR